VAARQWQCGGSGGGGSQLGGGITNPNMADIKQND
jgi:hypothetical protein